MKWRRWPQLQFDESAIEFKDIVMCNLLEHEGPRGAGVQETGGVCRLSCY